jgi:MFS family permease
MGRFTAMALHLSLCLVGGVLYFLFVLPRWWELMGDTSHTLGTVLRIVTGLVIAVAAVPVLLTLIRTRRPELTTPQLALRMRQWSMILHVTAGALIVATAVSEIWLSLDSAGPWLFGVYGAAAALAVLGMLAFYLAFIAELPPKPVKEKKPRKKRGKKTDEASAEETTGSDEASEEKADDETPTEVSAETPAEAEAESEAEPEAGALRNKRPSGKTSHRLRRRNRGGVALDD